MGVGGKKPSWEALFWKPKGTVITKLLVRSYQGLMLDWEDMGIKMIHGIQVKVWIKIGVFKQTLCEVVTCPLP